MSKEISGQQSPHPLKIFRPIPTKIGTGSSVLSSFQNSLVQPSPIFLQKEIQMRFRPCPWSNGDLSQSCLSNQTKPESNTRNPMFIQFDSFSPMCNKFIDSNNKTPEISKNFFGDSQQKDGIFKIKSFLFPHDKDKSGSKNELNESGKKKQGTFVTNIFNNFYINLKDNSPNNNNTKIRKNTKELNLSRINVPKAEKILLKKRGRKPFPRPKSCRPKKIKKKDKTQITLKLNQICINNLSINRFPIVELPEEDTTVTIFLRMLNEENYFNVIEKNSSDTSIVDEECFNKPNFLKNFSKEKKRIKEELLLIDENEEEENPIEIVKNFYAQIKRSVLTIQKNFIGKKKNSLNIEERIRLQKLIQSCNEITDIITDFKRSGRKKRKNISPIPIPDYQEIMKGQKHKQKHYKTYLCEFCNKAYPNGQGLGGHMSRLHPNQSYKYKDKIRIRNERVDKRKRLYEIKKKFFLSKGLNLDEMTEKGEKDEIQKFLYEHRDEYHRVKKEEQKKYNSLISHNSEHHSNSEQGSEHSDDESKNL